MRNFTPHKLTLLDGDDNVIAELESEGSARVQTFERFSEQLVFGNSDIPVVETEFGKVQGLPEPERDTFLVVSRIVAAALPYRDDLLVPNTSPTNSGAVRDEEGRIKGVRSLVRL